MQKSDQYKKVNISVLIVKIIPGQESISNYFSSVLVPKWPSQDDHSSLFSNLRLISQSLLDLANAEGGNTAGFSAANYREVQQTSQSWLDGTKETHLSPSPKVQNRYVFSTNLQTSSSFQCNLLQSSAKSRSEVIRPLGCSGA